MSSQASPAESADRIKPKADDVSKGRIDQPQVEAKSAEAEMQPHVAAAKGQKDASKKADETPPSKRATPAATASAAPIPSQVVYEKSVSEHKEVDKEKQVLSLLRKMKELLTEAMMTEAKTLAEEIIALDPENVVANATLSRSNKNIFRNLKKARFRRKNSKRERERIDSTCGAF